MLFHPLYKKMCSDENLNLAWRAVRRRKHATGVDRVTVSHFDSKSFLLLKALQQELLTSKYQPQPVKRVFIKREVGKLRPVGIPTIRDRIVQRALAQVLIPIFEPLFDDYSHAYRTARSPQTAIAQARDHALGSRPWMIKIDLSDCFGSIPHRPLLRRINAHVRDFAIRRLIKRFLDVDVITESNSRLQQISKQQGLLQGSPLSPLLANIYLDMFDKRAREKELRFVRYGDDIAIFAATREQAEKALDIAVRLLEKMHLRINRGKTRLLHLANGSQYLGEWIALQKAQNGSWQLARTASK